MEFIHEIVTVEPRIISDVNDDYPNTTTDRNFWLR